MTRLRHIEVVIPARNEQDNIADCLYSVGAAMQRLRRQRHHITCGTTVVLDSCTDDTAAIAESFNACGVVTDTGCVGAARHSGATDTIARARRAGIADRELWLANTDADSTVSDTWLLSQVLLSDSGIDVVIGTVTPAGLTEEINGLWHRQHHLTEGHQHVHGANLGMRASTYVEAVGFAPLPLHEDRDLVDRVKSVTDRWVATHRTNVMTSGRLHSRVDGGFATYVANLAAGDPTCA